MRECVQSVHESVQDMLIYCCQHGTHCCDFHLVFKLRG